MPDLASALPKWRVLHGSRLARAEPSLACCVEIWQAAARHCCELSSRRQCQASPPAAALPAPRANPPVSASPRFGGAPFGAGEGEGRVLSAETPLLTSFMKPNLITITNCCYQHSRNVKNKWQETLHFIPNPLYWTSPRDLSKAGSDGKRPGCSSVAAEALGRGPSASSRALLVPVH